MDNLNQSAYIRIPFELTAGQIEATAQLTLGMRYDDGFVAYLWSDQLVLPVEIARANAPGDPQTVPIDPLPVNAQATRSHSNRSAVNFEDFDVTDALAYLREGTNYLVIQGMNQLISSHDFLIGPQLIAKRKLSDLPGGVYAYSEPITVDQNTRITARAFDLSTEEWSGSAIATFVVETPQLVISELNYHPYDATADELAVGFTNRDDFEFIEIQNVGSRTTNLVGTKFTEGIEFEFPSVELAPGQYGVIVANLEAFQTRYGTDIPVLGQYADNLNNAGEKLTVVSATGEVLLDFVYGDSTLWPRSADGFGATLQLISPADVPAEQMGKYYQWRGSNERGGSPAAAGSPAMGVAINEVLSNPAADFTDAIELLNTTSAEINLGGWYLSDSGDVPMKYQFPANTVLGPSQYLVVTEAQFNPDNAGDNGFGLSGTRGDSVWLTVVDASGQISSFVDDVQFGSAVQGESFGRVPDGSGPLAPMTSITLGNANAAPRVGPVVISEVNYHPGEPSEAALAVDATITESDLEFVEIHNPTSETVDFGNWRLRGGVDFDFAAGTTLAPGQTLVVIPFDPSNPANATRLAALRTQYGFEDGVMMVGGYQGQLSNNGERVQLQRPGIPPENDPTSIPRLLEDEVIYDDLAPWPADADGRGPSLQRHDLSGWGNAASSWSSGNPTPGSIQEFVPEAGDANLDRQFDQLDIVLVLEGGKYLTGQPATWAQGDWNGDGSFNQLDIVAALQTNNYLQGPYAVLNGPVGSRLAVDREADVADRLFEMDPVDEDLFLL
jgi:hypothetical protein